MTVTTNMSDIAQAEVEGLRNNGISLILKLAEMAFNENSMITSLYWHQYTPYFDDGNTCTFKIGGVYCMKIPPVYGSTKPLREQFANWVESQPELLLFLFGDHKTVTITKDLEIEIEEYEEHE